MPTQTDLVAAGDRRALANLISRIEREDPEAREILGRLHGRTGKAMIVGITGAPGTGKSTLAAVLARAFRLGAGGEPPRTVGILAVDPTSPFSGGAVLGDRIRMRDLAGDAGVFIRSMASRGQLGGLSRASEGAVRALDAAGFEVILVETVGVGQDEVEIARRAHTVVVVETPGLGDDIQALKAGILEIADILVVNKADLPGADSAAASLRAMLGPSSGGAGGWETPIILTTAAAGKGGQELAAAIREHRDFLRRTGADRKRERDRAEADLRERMRERLFERWQSSNPRGLAGWIERIAARECSPEDAAEKLLGE
ncbi:MAG: methylmalonyl Co-A mutase-associated GTPase MeaB [Anaerolineales bacterium]|nr:methylmalonyl Co-A mutase-associated GTPase MeaB [Anaerolineales bacterium]